MPRYFLEIFYKGTRYSGFQSQHNANTIQSEVEKAFKVLHRTAVVMTGSSRTDAGVHALQNYFHFDFGGEVHPQFRYKMNAILPGDIVIRSISRVSDDAHCRFGASGRTYRYYIYRQKNPFLAERAFYYPYTTDLQVLKDSAEILLGEHDFSSFSKTRTQVKTFTCTIWKSSWVEENGMLVYEVEANRFLRGMVRALTATMLLAGRKKISLEDFREIILAKDNRKSNFAVPAHGLFLISVNFPEGYLAAP